MREDNLTETLRESRRFSVAPMMDWTRTIRIT
jgi:hypothetical protein